MPQYSKNAGKNAIKTKNVWTSNVFFCFLLSQIDTDGAQNKKDSLKIQEKGSSLLMGNCPFLSVF